MESRSIPLLLFFGGELSNDRILVCVSFSFLVQIFFLLVIVCLYYCLAFRETAGNLDLCAIQALRLLVSFSPIFPVSVMLVEVTAMIHVAFDLYLSLFLCFRPSANFAFCDPDKLVTFASLAFCFRRIAIALRGGLPRQKVP